MRTLIISDLHLGSLSGADLLRRPQLRGVLLDALAEVDRLVLLGDVLELRHGPAREAMAAAREFFEDLGRAMAGREVMLTAGNHDHALVEPWLFSRGEEIEPPPLSAEQLLEPEHVSAMAARIAGWLAPASVRVAYPGLWVREDVYATHGHYLDAHLTVPTLERLGMAAMSRMLRRPAAAFSGPDDYEAMGSPVFAWRDAVARGSRTGDALNGMATVNAWSALRGSGRRPRSADGTPLWRSPRAAALLARRGVRRRAIRTAFPLAVAALNRAGLGPLSATISTDELRSAGLRAMGEAAARLGVGDAYVVFGHTHRAGPFAGDQHGEWLGPSGARLVNCGSWTYAPIFLTERVGESPYWPGTAVLVADGEPPQLLRLLHERPHAELAPVRRPPAREPA